MPTVEVKPTTRRDLCYTASIARDIDKVEIRAAGPRNATECGYITWEAMELYGGLGWTAWVDDNPEFSFGFTPQGLLMPHLWSAWAWGSDKVDLCMIEIARWAKGPPSLVDRFDIVGLKRIEARSIREHHESHRWLEWLGFVRECDLPEWGVAGERFVQYRWLRSEWAGFGRHGNATFSRGKDHVHGRRRLQPTTTDASID